MSASWRRLCAFPTDSIRDVAIIIQATGARVALVIDADERLVGIITDGDLRRAVLGCRPLSEPAAVIMNTSPHTAPMTADRQRVREMMKARSLIAVPIVDEFHRLVDVILYTEEAGTEESRSVAVVMAGGRGSRLRPLTDSRPKPLLPVRGAPILDHILTRIKASGITSVFIAVNYLSEQIRDHLGDGEAIGMDIGYLSEEEPLGTAGALAFLPDRSPNILVTNGDILTDVDYAELIRFHEIARASATVCVRDYHTQLPYGVVRTDVRAIVEISEKPTLIHQVLAGIYVLSREVVDTIPQGQWLDMPDLLRKLVEGGQPVVSYPLSGLWIDIGDHASYALAQRA